MDPRLRGDDRFVLASFLEAAAVDESLHGKRMVVGD
jgi:hypothetical protein